MKRNTILLVIVITFIIAGGIFLKNKKVIAPTDEIKIVPMVQKNLEGKYCYTYHQVATSTAPYAVDEFINITVADDVVNGTKKGTQAGPDMTNGYEGSLKGTLDKDTMDVIFSYVVEGSANKEKEIYVVKEDRLQKLRYPLMEQNKILVPDTTKEYKTLDYMKTDCITPVTEQKEKFGEIYTVKIGGKISFSDGLTMTLKKIDDSRCKQGVQCFWQGELNPVFEATGGAFGNEKQEIRLGVMTTKSFSLKSYTFTLKNAIENTVDIIVSNTLK